MIMKQNIENQRGKTVLNPFITLYCLPLSVFVEDGENVT